MKENLTKAGERDSAGKVKRFRIDSEGLLAIISVKWRFTYQFIESIGITKQMFYRYIREKHYTRNSDTLNKIVEGLKEVYPTCSTDYIKKLIIIEEK